MDKELAAVKSHLKLCYDVLSHRAARLDSTTSKQSRHYNRVQHTKVMMNLVAELSGLVMQDPDNWDDEPDLVPF